MELNNENPLVSIIILNYNAGKLLEECVESIYRGKYENFEIIVVDNDSKDESDLKCKEKFPTINVIKNKENLGYCEGNNVGIRSAKGEFVIVLNPDTLVETNWINELLNSYKKIREGIYQPKFLTIGNESILQSTGNMIQLFGFGYSRNKGDKDKNEFKNIQNINYASGTCLFTSMKIFKQLDYFDSFLFAYHDDLDFCWRASMQGIKSYYVPTAIVYHPSEGFSFKWSNFKFFLLERNRLYCLFTHYSDTTILKFLPSLILVDLAVSVFYLKNRLFCEKIKASIDILKNFGTIRKKYHTIQKNRIVSDKEIISHFKNELVLPKGTSIKNKIPFNSVLRVLARLSRMMF